MWYLDNINVVRSEDSKKRQATTAYKDYFSVMALTASQLKYRIEVAQELEEALFLLFLSWFYEADEEEAEEQFVDRYLSAVEKYDNVGLEDDFVEYVVLLAAMLHRSTMTAKEDYEAKDDETAEKTSDGRPYFASIDRATFVAANEANTALNKIEYHQAVRGGMKYKTWHTERDLRVRPTHVPHDGETIPIDDLFDIGGVKMRFPKDMMDSDNLNLAREVTQCRCTVEYS